MLNVKFGDKVEFKTGRIVAKSIGGRSDKTKPVAEVLLGMVWKVKADTILIRPWGLQATTEVPKDNVIPLKDECCVGAQIVFKHVGMIRDFKQILA